MFGATYTRHGEVILNFEGDWIIGRPLMPLDLWPIGLPGFGQGL